jgi:hypothetical protein
MVTLSGMTSTIFLTLPQLASSASFTLEAADALQAQTEP